MKILLILSRFLSTYTSYFIIAIAVVTFFFPVLFSWVHGDIQSLILGFIMLTMGLTLTLDDMRILAARPWDILVSSNIMSYLCKGDVAFSVGMTTASTLLAPVVTPLLVLWLAGEKVEVDALGMFRNILLVTLLPVTIGFFCNLFMGRNESFRKAQSVMPAFSVIGLACIVGGVVSAVHDKLLMEGITFFLIVLVVVFFHNGLGYLLGYSVGKMFHFSAAKNRTISIEVGMQNAGLATVLASEFFIVSCPLAVIPCAVSCAWHSISGTIMAQILAPSEKE